MINGNDSSLSKMMQEGNVQEFTQEVNSMASVINVFADEKNGTDDERKNRQEV
jgi:hypothetical protein